MQPDLLVDRVLDDEGLIGDLDEAEASVLVAAVVESVRKVCDKTNDMQFARAEVEKLCKQARRIAAVVSAFRDKSETEAKRICSTEGWSWPAGVLAPIDLLHGLLNQLH